MAPPTFSLYLLQEWFSTLFAPSCNADVVLSAARHEEDLKQGILGTSETCDAGLLEQDGKEGEMVEHKHNGIIVSDGRPSQSRHIHEGGISDQMSSRFSSPAKPSDSAVPRFILDSRAACHAVSNMSLFSSSSFTSVVPAARTSWATSWLNPNGSRSHHHHLPIVGVGTISCDKFHLTDVLYVPGMRAGLNLVSVQQLAERDYLVMFGGGQCSVKERSTGRIVGKGRMHDDDGLYHLDFLTIP